MNARPRSVHRPAARRRRAIALAALALTACAAIAAVLVVGARGDDAAEERLRAYVAAWSAGDDRAAAALTDDARTALRALAASRRGLDGASVAARVEDVDDGRASVRVRWRVPRIGAWSYRVRIVARETGDGWKVAWRPTAVHPRMRRGMRLGTSYDAPRRGRILDRHGRALVEERSVVHVALRAGRTGDPAATARTVAALTGTDAGALRTALQRAPSGRFVPVVTLRRPDYTRVAERLERVPGISVAPDRAPLAPTKTFARALLGTVGPATAEQIQRARGRLAPGDHTGQSGLQAAYERRLGGTGERRIVLRSTEGGDERATLLERPGRHGRGLRTTLDAYVQGAAEDALGDLDANAALVAVQPSTGDVLAIANRPADSTYDRARLGLYPPGSTFKVISTAALLRDGLDVDETVPCPPTTTVNGRSFRNFEGGEQGDVPFALDFAQSCNTAFVALADRLDRDALERTGRDYGLGRTLKLGLPAADGKVPVATEPVDRAASMIGQSRIVASPLTMAGVAAAVADGRWRAPRLLSTDGRKAGPALPDGEVATLRALMRKVVQEGTGTALDGLPGEPIGKSGTAEYGSGDPPPTHAWFIAARDDVAVAVLVEGGRAGSEVAAPIAARFFAGVDLAEGTS